MQNKENGFGRFVKEKGYYIVLLLCAVAIGVSGYLLLSGKNSDQQVHLSTERATVPPGVRATEHAENVVATDGPEPGTEATEPTLRLQPPVAGEQTEALRRTIWPTMRRRATGARTRASIWPRHSAIRSAPRQTGLSTRSMRTSATARPSCCATAAASRRTMPTSPRSRMSPWATRSAPAAPRHVGQTALTETGDAPHVHFALYNGNTPEDPAEYWQ